jgi:hypothetical protein
VHVGRNTTTSFAGIDVRKMADRAEDAESGALFKNQPRRRDGQGPQVVCEVDKTPVLMWLTASFDPNPTLDIERLK